MTTLKARLKQKAAVWPFTSFSLLESQSFLLESQSFFFLLSTGKPDLEFAFEMLIFQRDCKKACVIANQGSSSRVVSVCMELFTDSILPQN